VTSIQPNHILSEMESQPETWEVVLPLVSSRAQAVREVFGDTDEVIFSGCGSALNAALTIAPTFQAKTGVTARAVPAAEICRFLEAVVGKGARTAAVLLSRSGQTTEVVQALDHLHGLGIQVLAITCTASSALATGSELAFVLTPATERAISTTRPLTSMIPCGQMLAAVTEQDERYLVELQGLPDAVGPS